MGDNGNGHVEPPAPGEPSKASPVVSSRLFTGVFIAIIGVTLCTFIAGQGLNAGTSVYISRLGGSATLAGIGAAVFSGAAIGGRLVSGPLADTRGRLLVMASGAFILLVGVLGAGICADVNLIMIWRFLQGLGFSAVTTASATAAADVLPAERLGEGIGYYGLGQAIAMSMGPALAIALVSSDPPENLFWGLAVAAALSLLLCAFCRYEKHPDRLPETATYRTLAQKRTSRDDAESQGKRKSIATMIFEPGALAGGIPMMVLSPAFGFGIYFVGLLGTELGVGNAGLFYTVSAIAMIVVRVSSRAFMDRVLPIKLLAMAIASGVAGFSILLVTSIPLVSGMAQEALFYAAGIFYGLCIGIALPVNQTVAVKNSSAERWGAANGLFLLLLDLGIGLASIVWGITNDQMGFPFTIACVIAFMLASLLVAFITYPPSAKHR
uniref:Permease of the major facilitator superfamily protein n=1 Tax=uncultured bacterium Contig1772 TaxID=1393512 RepID=W0FJW8_9BACT|nr:permease of the major facilitator superfamily protein [uncultured bacterium Contig1772]